MWMWRLDKQKLFFIALWVTRAMLNHLARIHSPHCCSPCIGHERHYDFLPQALSFVLFSFLLPRHIYTKGPRARRNRWS
ncbi:hypothetical protein EDD85DRAFT_98970 [Armillaria nabsnona]|nr:hypothetical protein EDD85DRAFT_98970 [Armillaria nabsnona]